MKNVKVAVISLCSTEDVDSNLINAEESILDAVRKKANWIVLPEAFPYIGPDGASVEANSKCFENARKMTERLAKENKVVIFAGTIPQPDSTGQKLLNRLEVFGRDGSSLAVYDKTHLFELYDEQGRSKISESKIYASGDRSSHVEIDGYRVALAVCYDLRFPKYFLDMTHDIDVIVAPSAFTYVTGEAHWSILLKARAIDNQCYVIGATQTGEHFKGRKSYGHPAIIDPWGSEVATGSERPETIFGDLNPETLKTSRSRLQLKRSARTDLCK